MKVNGVPHAGQGLWKSQALHAGQDSLSCVGVASPLLSHSCAFYPSTQYLVRVFLPWAVSCLLASSAQLLSTCFIHSIQCSAYVYGKSSV